MGKANFLAMVQLGRLVILLRNQELMRWLIGCRE
jgi:hypothetical protein